MLNEEKSLSSYKKRRFRCRRNPKHKKFRRKKQRKMNTQLRDTQRNQPTTSLKVLNNSTTISTSYGESFWCNYKKVMDWSNSYMENYWKHEASRLQKENICLKQRLELLSKHQENYAIGAVDERLNNYNNHDDDYNDNHYEVYNVNPNEVYNRNYNAVYSDNHDDVYDNPEEVYDYHDEVYDDQDEVYDDNDASDDYEVTEEFMKFIELSLRHKSSRETHRDSNASRKEKQYNYEESELFDAPSIDNSRKRNLEMKQLYGNESAKIHGMETAVNLGFMRKCDKNKPVMWPVIALAH